MHKVSSRYGASSVFAALLAALAMVMAAFVALPSAQADPTGPSVSVSLAPRAGGEVTIKGTGFSTDGPGVYVGIGLSKYSDFYTAHASEDHLFGYKEGVAMTEDSSARYIYPPRLAQAMKSLANTAPLSADGTFTITMPSPAFAEGKEWAVFVTKAHGQGRTDKSQNVKEILHYEPAAVPSETTPEAGASPAEGTSEGETSPGAGTSTPTPTEEQPPTQPKVEYTVEPTETCPAGKIDVNFPHDKTPVETALEWGINSLYNKLGYTATVSKGATYNAGLSVFRPTKAFKASPVVEGDTFKMSFPGTVTYSKGKGAEKHDYFSISNPRLEINSNDHGEVYVTITDFSLPAEQQSREVHLGTFYGAINYDDNSIPPYGAFFTRDATLRVSPEAAGALPELNVNTEFPPLTFAVAIVDRNGYADPGQLIRSIWNLDPNANCARVTWLNRWVTPKPVTTSNDPVVVPPPPTVEEINKSWSEPATPQAKPGQLIWGIKGSWRGYISSGTHLSEGAELVQGQYAFPGGRVTSVAADGSKVIQYRGKLHFKAYGGYLWLMFSDPQVRIDAEGNQILWFKNWTYDDATQQGVPGNYFPAANLTGQAQLSEGVLSGQDQPAYLTKAMSDLFIYYQTGLRMANASYSVQLPALTSSDGAPLAVEQNMPVLTPEFTISVPGFEPAEMVTFELHSEPVVLGQAPADEHGVATLKATLPESVTPGPHTLIATGDKSGAVKQAVQVKAIEKSDNDDDAPKPEDDQVPPLGSQDEPGKTSTAAGTDSGTEAASEEENKQQGDEKQSTGTQTAPDQKGSASELAPRSQKPATSEASTQTEEQGGQTAPAKGAGQQEPGGKQSGKSAVSKSQLSNTGSESLTLAVAALVLLVAGASVVVVARTRRV